MQGGVIPKNQHVRHSCRVSNFDTEREARGRLKNARKPERTERLLASGETGLQTAPDRFLRKTASDENELGEGLAISPRTENI